MSLFKNKSKILKPFKNIFILILIVFIVWMLFFDANSYLIHSELNSDIKDLETEKEYYQKEISKDKKALKKLSTEEGLEKYKETYDMIILQDGPMNPVLQSFSKFFDVIIFQDGPMNYVNSLLKEILLQGK